LTSSKGPAPCASDRRAAISRIPKAFNGPGNRNFQSPLSPQTGQGLFYMFIGFDFIILLFNHGIDDPPLPVRTISVNHDTPLPAEGSLSLIFGALKNE
jgi:hypothetical protein